MIEYRNLKVALLGAGSVGSQVARLLLDHADELGSRVGAGIELVGIAVRNLDAVRDVELPAHLLTTDSESLITSADIVIELMGGIEPARSLILAALSSGADVITGNKALLAAHGPELFEMADQVGAQLYYEAAAGGAIPIIRPLRDSLAGDQITRVMGIVNGTTNFILDEMDNKGSSLEEALARATALGYAEADPTADIDGYDAAQKAAILARLAFHTAVPVDAVHREGIRSITAEDVRRARDAGLVVKLLAVCERIGTGQGQGISVRVHPALISRSHPLAATHGAKNAIFVEAEAAGDLMFYGAGAGGLETASAVLGDLVSAARRHVAGGPGVTETSTANLPVYDIGRVTTRYQVALNVVDAPGVLARIAGEFSEHSVSVEGVRQSVGPANGSAATQNGEVGTATLVIVTHEATDAALSATVQALSRHDDVVSVESVLRVEGAQ